MWRTQTSRQGKQIVATARRHFASEANTGNAVPPPKSPRPKSGGRIFFKLFGISVPLAAGGLLGYAMYDPDFRKSMELNVPYAKEALELILPETKKEPEVSKPLKPIIAPALDNVSTQTVPPPIPPVTFPVEEKVKDKPVKKEKEKTAVEDSKTATVTKTKPDRSEIQAELKKREEGERADNAALEVVIHRLLTSSQKLAEEAVKAHTEVAEVTLNHNKLLRHAMDDTDILNKNAQWEAVTVASKEREKAVVKCNELVAESMKTIDRLTNVIAESKANSVTKNNPAIYPATKRVAELTQQLNKANNKVRQAESEAKVMIKYKDLVEKGKKQFKEELESLFPDVKVGRSSRKLTEEELNALIAHAHRRIEQLQKQLAEQLSMEHQRLNASLATQKSENSKVASEMLKEETARLMNEFEGEKQKLEMDMLVEQESAVRKQLSMQAAAHSDHLKDVLSIQEQQLSQQFNRDLNTKLLEEREKFQAEVASWIGRLKGLESAIDARATSEKVARAAQDLWLACISLNSCIHFGGEADEAIKPLKPELQAILTAANKHPFVESVANAIPEEALQRGVYTEDSLRERFTKVALVCRRLGLLTDANRSLYRHLLSLLHSYFVFNSVQNLSEQDVVDLDELDNFDLLARAQYWVERGSLELALRYMNQLKGESYIAANDWIKEVKLLLETRQAATTLTAFASATGLANTF